MRSKNLPTTTVLSRFRAGTLLTAQAVDEMEDDLPFLVETMAWVRNFLGQPHPDLGRPGTVCPFIPDAVKRNFLYLEVVRLVRLDPKVVEEIVEKHRDIFLDLPPTEGLDAEHKAIIVVFPDIPLERAPDLIDGVQRRLKSHFVRKGVMLGEFHKLNKTPGLHNDKFFPLQTPYPSLAMRQMVETDLPFLMRSEDPPEMRVEFLEAWLNYRPRGADERRIGIAEQALAKARSELAAQQG